MSALIRDAIRDVGEYTLKQHPYRIKLNQNENPYELPISIKDEIARRLIAMPWSRYPAFVPEQQIEKLSGFTGWKSDGILLGNGSNDLLQLLFTCVLERGRGIVINQPTFTLYKILAKSLGADVHDVPMLKPFAFDVDRIISTANATDASLLVLCSPNNPTGTFLPREDLVRILENTQALVVLDEAYVQFAKQTQIELLNTYDRLVVLQTFSKAMGAAGLRFGYGLMDPGLARELNKVKLPYSVNIFTLLAAEVLMDRWQTIRGWIQTLIGEREFVRSELQQLPAIHAYESAANFVYFESLRKSPSEIFDALLVKGILVRNVSSYPMLERGLRVSIGTPEENREFLSVLKESL